MGDERKIQAVIFDMDGVLTDSEPLILAASLTMFKEKGLEVKPEDFAPFVGTGEDRYIGGVAEKYNFFIDLVVAKKRTYEIYLELVPSQLRAFPGACKLVGACRQAGLKIAVASSADRIKIDANLHKIGLPPETWDAIVTAEDVVHKKPAPDIFLAAAPKLGLTPEQCCVIEDAVNGVQAAKAAGMRCVAVAQSFPRDQLRSADLVKQEISDVSSADLLGEPAGTVTLPAAPPPLPQPQPWGFWATIGWGCLIAAMFVLTQLVVGIVFAVIAFASGHEHLLQDTKTLESNGLFLAMVTCATAPVMVGLCFLIARLRRGLAIKDYLALKSVAGATLFRWCLKLLVLVVLSDGLTSLLGRTIVPEFMTNAYQTAGIIPLLWLAMVVGAPLSEEIFFRGFLFAGLSRSRLGGGGAIVLTALLWSVIHLQYDLYGIATIFAGGLLLGYARLKTNSIYPCILMHALMNVVATIEVTVLVHVFGVENGAVSAGLQWF